MTARLLARFAAAYGDPDAVATAARAAGRRVIRTLGTDCPIELLRAVGFLPVRLAAHPKTDTSEVDRMTGDIGLSWRGRSLLQQLATHSSWRDPIVISHETEEQALLFGALRELADSLPLGPVYFSDLLHRQRETSHTYNRTRLAALRDELPAPGDIAPDDSALARAIVQGNRQKALIRQIFARRRNGRPLLSGVERLQIVGAAAILDWADHMALLEALDASITTTLPGRAGRPLFVTGSLQETQRIYASVENLGCVIVGEDHDWGAPWYTQCPDSGAAPLDALADPALRTPLSMRTLEAHARTLKQDLTVSGSELLLHICIEGDQVAPWQWPTVRDAAAAAGLPALMMLVPADGTLSHGEAERLSTFLIDPASNLGPVHSKTVVPDRAEKPSRRGKTPARSRKSLQSVASFGSFQRDWFADVRRRVAAGEPLAVVNANSPQEILRALDIPFVVNQWWAAIVAAKQQSPRYRALLEDRGFPGDHEAYSAQGLAAVFDTVSDDAPWGGLPQPAFLQAMNNTDPTATIFQHWQQATRANLYLFERTVDPRWRIETDWWDRFPNHWDAALEAERLDLQEAELREAITILETSTGRRFDPERFRQIMDLVNEQEDYYRRTRDLIARTRPAPASIVDTMPATMVPQWHRGSEWARDAARAFHDEVVARVEAGEAACPNEKVRLMWIGRGLWSDMSFYQRWEDSHGAVFVWSMYLSLAADGYIRRFDGGRDPLRALAARVVTMGDELRLPSWASAWHVREARSHGIDGVIALSDADPLSLRALEKEGFPVLRLGIDNYDPDSFSDADVDERVTRFIETRAMPLAEKRKG